MKRPVNQPSQPASKPNKWNIYHIKGTPAVLLGQVEAPDEESAIERAIEEFRISPTIQKRLLAAAAGVIAGALLTSPRTRGSALKGSPWDRTHSAVSAPVSRAPPRSLALPRFAAEVADAAARAEAKAVIDRWNEQLLASRDMLWSPTNRAALIAGTPWLDVFCPGAARAGRLICERVIAILSRRLPPWCWDFGATWCPGCAHADDPRFARLAACDEGGASNL
jgi:hypothetical protein